MQRPGIQTAKGQIPGLFCVSGGKEKRRKNGEILFTGHSAGGSGANDDADSTPGGKRRRRNWRRQGKTESGTAPATAQSHADMAVRR